MGTIEFFEPSEREQSDSTSEHNFLFNTENLEEFERYIKAGTELIARNLKEKNKPFSGIQPKALAEKFQGIDIATPTPSLDDALNELQTLYLNDAVYFHHRKYVGHLNCPVNYPSLLAEHILTSINSSVDTWDQSAGGTLIEQTLIDWTNKIIGFDEQADGIFTSGGTQSNLMAMLLARDAQCEKHLPGHSIKEQGLPEIARKFRIFTSAMSHFSVQKSAALLGLGYQSVVSVPADSEFKMDITALQAEIEQCIEQGNIPIAVVATAGTTDFGSIDPLQEISRICREYDMWMHADAAYGCGLLVSPTQRMKLNGIELADSVTVDYHKSFLQPVSCSAFFAKNKRHLDCVTHHADYLNPLCAKQDGTPNLVNKSLQTTRRFDALKLWLSLRVIGSEKIGSIFDEVCHLATEVHALFEQDEDIEIIHKPELSTVVFRFHPQCQPALSNNTLDDLNHYIRKAIFRSGEAVISGTRVHGERYLKFTLLNPTTDISDIKDILKLIKSHGFTCLHSLLHQGSTQSSVCIDSLVERKHIA